MPRYQIRTEHEFFARHAIRLYDGSVEPLHEHHWKLRVTVERDALDSIGVVTDFHDLQAQVEQIIGPWRGGSLNDIAPFTDLQTHNPTAEVIAAHVAERITLDPPLRLVGVDLLEAPGCWARWRV